MKALIAVLLFSSAAIAQTGTNAGSSQTFAKPRTGVNSQVVTSPDINTYLTGTSGSTTGQPPDVAGPQVAIAGAASAAALTTADVTTRETLERQRLTALIGKTQAPAQPELPSPPFVATSSQGKAYNGRNTAEESRRSGLQQGPSTDSGPASQNSAQQPAKPLPSQQPPKPQAAKKPQRSAAVLPNFSSPGWDAAG